MHTKQEYGLWAVVERAEKVSEAPDARSFARSLCAFFLCLLLAVVPIVLAKSHGPGAYAEAQRAEAALALHGHAHDWDEHGLGKHNVTDHDHGSFVYVVTSENSFEIQTRRVDFRITGGWHDGPEGGGLHRPPRVAVL